MRVRKALTGATPEEFRRICASASSIAEICRKLAVVTTGATYRIVRRRADLEKVDLSHIPRGLSNNLGRISNKRKTTLADILSCRWPGHLKRMLVREGFLVNKCAICLAAPVWQGKILVLRLDHIDGDRNNNTHKNLRLVCPNCDSQLPTFAGRNFHPPRTCSDCGKRVTSKSKRCVPCANKATPHSKKIRWPRKDHLARMVRTLGFSAAGRKLGVSDNAIRKHLLRTTNTPIV